MVNPDLSISDALALAHGEIHQEAQCRDYSGLLGRTNSLTWTPLHLCSADECPGALRSEDGVA